MGKKLANRESPDPKAIAITAREREKSCEQSRGNFFFGKTCEVDVWRCAVGREYEEVAPVSHIFFGKKGRRRRNANRCQGFPSFFFVSRIKKSKLLAIQSEKKGAGGKECQIAAKATFT